MKDSSLKLLQDAYPLCFQNYDPDCMPKTQKIDLLYSEYGKFLIKKFYDVEEEII